MPLFGKKKKDNKAAAAPAAAVSKPQQQTVKIVGDSKHVTTTRVDEQGRMVQQTTIMKLTPAEMQQLGMTPAPSAQVQRVPPPQARPPPQAQVRQAPPEQRQYQAPPPYNQPPPQKQQQLPPPQQPQYHQPKPPPPQAPPANDIMRTPPSPISDNQSNGTSTRASVTNIPVGDESLATIEVTRELVKKFISDIWNRGEVELIPEVCHPSLRFNGHVGMDRVGHEGFSRMVVTVREALTDYHCEIHSMVVETNKAFCRLRFTGKHTGNLLGYPPTGKTVAWMGASEFTCKNGKILKVWELGDVKSLEEQLRSTD